MLDKNRLLFGQNSKNNFRWLAGEINVEKLKRTAVRPEQLASVLLEECTGTSTY